jgi:cytochrome c oxidase subunit IV
MGNSHQGHHIVSESILKNVFIALVILTVLTVVTAKFVYLGPFGGIVAFAIASVKAYFVMAYFMGLKYDDVTNRIIFSMGFIFLAVLFIFCVLDIYTRVFQTSTL